jgi:predicted short-subunit dehydrogenase-like oxidoreductase (DUF2520 family)
MVARRPGLILVGPGRVGRALARALLKGGWPVTAVAGGRGARARNLARSLGSGVQAHVDPLRALPRGNLVLVALPQAELPGFARRIAGSPGFAGKSRIFLHTSGAAPGTALEALQQAGAATGRFHPLYPFAGSRGEESRLRGVHFAVDGHREAVSMARRLARALGGKVLELPAGSEESYHLSAVLASNLVVALAAEAAGLGPRWGRERDEALEALLPLLRAAVEQLEARGLPDALTGPVTRGEAHTLRRHLDLLENMGEEELAMVYRLLSRTGLDLALEGERLDAGQRRRIDEVLRPRRRGGRKG